MGTAKLTPTPWIWMDGRFVRWDEAKIHVLSHVVHYGSSVFEGLRCYPTPDGPAIFRLKDHVRRLFRSCRIYRMEPNVTQEEVADAICEVIERNDLEAAYIRPVVYRGYEALGLDPSPCPVRVAVAAWPWGRYLGADSATAGVDVRVSSWRRLAPDTLPAIAKAGANYMNSQLIKLEAIADGYAEGVALDTEGFVSEGSGENIFVVIDDVLYTPPWDSSVLIGITRDSVMALAGDLGIEVKERRIPRELLYVADEIFLCGTAAEITPVRSVDHVQLGGAMPGPITALIERAFDDLVHGRVEDRRGWLHHVTDLGVRRVLARAGAALPSEPSWDGVLQSRVDIESLPTPAT
jgi:branched-chain amino acid aminotransferase